MSKSSLSSSFRVICTVLTPIVWSPTGTCSDDIQIDSVKEFSELKHDVGKDEKYLLMTGIISTNNWDRT